MPYTSTGGLYVELGGSPTYNKSTDTAAATDTWMVPWAHAFDFCDEIMPQPILIGGIAYQPPRWAFRYDTNLKVDSIDLTPFFSEEPGITGSSDASDWAKMKVSYKVSDKEEEPEEDNDDPETFLTHRISIGAEMMTVPGRNVVLETPASTSGSASASAVEAAKKMTDEDAPITILMPTAEQQFTWKKVLNPPFAAIYRNIGKVNEANWLGADGETLMFLGCDAQREFTTGSVEPWTLDYRFTHRCAKPLDAPSPLTWNHFYVPKTESWQKLEFAGGNNAYQTGDFINLFRHS